MWKHKIKMKQLTGINIRSGLELEVPVEDIFMPDLSSSGDVRVKNFFGTSEGVLKIKKTDDEFFDFLKKEKIATYREYISTQQLDTNLKVSIFSEHQIIYNRLSKNNLEKHLSTSLVFYNTEIISLEDFCFNFMNAQAFTGNFKQTEIQNSFVGIGDFGISEIAPFFPLAMAGNLNLEYFFIYHKGILSSVENIIMGRIDQDLESQKSYVSKKEYNLILKELEEQKKEIEALLMKKAQI